MATLCRFVAQIGRSFVLPKYNRALSLSATTHTSQRTKVIEKTEGEDIIIEGVTLPAKSEPFLLKTRNGVCPICSTGLDVKHTDVLILQQFVRRDGCMLPRRTTGLCKVQQKRVGIMVTMAQKAGLMPNLAPENSRKDPTKRRLWKKYNTYFDETTIKFKYL